MALIRIILILILVVYLVRFLDKYIVPALFGKTGKDTRSAGKGQQREGEVTLEDRRKQSRDRNRDQGLNPDSGDYVDYEEVKD